jgi:hypothetical protein
MIGATGQKKGRAVGSSSSRREERHIFRRSAAPYRSGAAEPVAAAISLRAPWRSLAWSGLLFGGWLMSSSLATLGELCRHSRRPCLPA